MFETKQQEYGYLAYSAGAIVDDLIRLNDLGPDAEMELKSIYVKLCGRFGK